MEVAGVSPHSVSTTQAALTPQKPEVPTTPTTVKTATVPPQHDTVELTGAALAKSLKLAGQKPAQIALKMGIDVKTVDQYLSIKTATAAPAAPTPAAVHAPVPGAKQAAATTAAAPQTFSPAEEVKEPASQKAAETAQGKK